MMPLILITCFLILAIFFRVFIHYRRTGDLGLRSAKPDSPLIEIIPGTIFIVSFALAFLAVTLGYFGKIQATIDVPNIVQYFGFTIGLIGIIITVISQTQMGDSWRIGINKQENTQLIKHGLYAKSRNPIYLGIFIFWIGLCLTFANILLWICASVCWICIEFIVRKNEEPYLEKIHGQDFTDYVSKTNRYLPF